VVGIPPPVLPLILPNHHQTSASSIALTLFFFPLLLP
jgi:hypothetical protein